MACAQAFDELLLLKRGGKVIYNGATGKDSADLVRYFEGIEGVPKLQEGINPATWMLEISTVSAEERLGRDFSEIYNESDLFRHALQPAGPRCTKRSMCCNETLHSGLEQAIQYAFAFRISQSLLRSAVVKTSLTDVRCHVGNMCSAAMSLVCSGLGIMHAVFPKLLVCCAKE